MLGHLPVQGRMSPGTALDLTNTHPPQPYKGVPPFSASTPPGHNPSNLH